MPIFEISLPKSLQKALGIPPKSPKRAQLRVLKKLLRRAKYTAFGQQFEFDKILLTKRPDKVFQQKVPAFNYNKIYAQWWHLSLEGDRKSTRLNSSHT